MLDILIKGGWMMIPLVICSIAAVAVAIDRFIAFWSINRYDYQSLRAKVMEMLEQGKPEEAALICMDTPGPVSAVLLSGIQSYIKHKQIGAPSETLIKAVADAMDDYSQHALAAVEKRMMILSTVANAAPLLGMTGTVVGMIASFEMMKEQAGEVDKVMGGISIALITTAAGLIIALIAVLPYNYFMSKSDKIALDIEEASSELQDFLATRIEVAHLNGEATPSPKAAPAPVAAAVAAPAASEEESPVVKKVVKKKVIKKVRRKPEE